jgi:hypothetical protein
MIVYCHSYGYHLGLGCFSGAYLLYGVNSTSIWLFCVLSSVLAHCHEPFKDKPVTGTFIWGASLALRYMAKCVAAGNAVWLFLTAIFQFSDLDNNCWCNSNKLFYSKAYTVITYTDPLLTFIKIAWAGGLVMSFLTAALFLIVLNVLPTRLAKEPDPTVTIPRSPQMRSMRSDYGQSSPTVVNRRCANDHRIIQDNTRNTVCEDDNQEMLGSDRNTCIVSVV